VYGRQLLRENYRDFALCFWSDGRMTDFRFEIEITFAFSLEVTLMYNLSPYSGMLLSLKPTEFSSLVSLELLIPVIGSKHCSF